MTMGYDKDKVDEVVIALLYLTLHDEFRASKNLDFEAMERPFGKGLIYDPRSRNKSVALTEEGLSRSKALFERYFAKRV